MLWETLGSAIAGLVLAWVAVRRMPSRLPHRRLVLPTGSGGGLVGGLLAYAVMGPGNVVAVLVAAVGVSVAALSLLCSGGATPRSTVPPRTAAPRPH